MDTRIKKILAIVWVLFALSSVNAQQQTPQALSELMRLEGKWEGPATLTLDGKTHEFIYYADFRKTANGSGIYMEEWFTAPELGNENGSSLIGYNANDGKIHWFSVDNFGTTHEHLGTWKSDNHFFMQANEMQGKNKFVEKVDLTFKGNDTLELVFTATLDGKEFEKGIVSFLRTK